MARRARIGELKVKHVEAALLAEEQALTTVHVAVTKQLRRLEAEEQLLQEILKRAEHDEAEQQQQKQQGQEGAGQQPSAQLAQPAQQQGKQRQQRRAAEGEDE